MNINQPLLVASEHAIAHIKSMENRLAKGALLEAAPVREDLRLSATGAHNSAIPIPV